MKKTALFLCVAGALFVMSCESNATNTAMVTFPAPGTVMDSAAMPIIADSLNDAFFSVTIIADSNIKSGIYDVRAAYGNNVANGMFSMPKGAEHYKPVIKKGSAPYTYIVGFNVPKDTTFYDYFEVTAKRDAIGMKYLKAYTFE